MAAIAEADPTLITDASHFPPLSQLLPRCSAIMHHGDGNITAAALTSATPQIICPVTCDQLASVRALRLQLRLSAVQMHCCYAQQFLIQVHQHLMDVDRRLS